MMNKKGAWVLTLITIGALASIIVFFAYNISANPIQFTFDIGEKSLTLIKASKNAEKTLIYVDRAGQNSVVYSVLELSEKGGFLEQSECGEYNRYNLWNSEERECYPDRVSLKKNVLEEFDQNFKIQFENYLTELVDNYDYFVNDRDEKLEIYGIAAQDLSFAIGAKEERFSFTQFRVPEVPQTYDPSYNEIDIYLESEESPLIGLGQCILDAEERTDIPWQVILAVTIHESNFGKSQLANGICPAGKNPSRKLSNNLFSIKGKGPAGSCKWPTWECLTEEQKKNFDIVGCQGVCSNGREKCQVWDDFRAYNNKCESVNDFVNLISRASRYRGAMEHINDPEEMIRQILEAGYATDPEWDDKVNNLMAVAYANVASTEPSPVTASAVVRVPESFILSSTTEEEIGIYSIKPSFKVDVEGNIVKDFEMIADKVQNDLFEQVEDCETDETSPQELGICVGAAFNNFNSEDNLIWSVNCDESEDEDERIVPICVETKEKHFVFDEEEKRVMKKPVTIKFALVFPENDTP